MGNVCKETILIVLDFWPKTWSRSVEIPVSWANPTCLMRKMPIPRRSIGRSIRAMMFEICLSWKAKTEGKKTVDCWLQKVRKSAASFVSMNDLPEAWPKSGADSIEIKQFNSVVFSWEDQEDREVRFDMPTEARKSLLATACIVVFWECTGYPMFNGTSGDASTVGRLAQTVGAQGQGRFMAVENWSRS